MDVKPVSATILLVIIRSWHKLCKLWSMYVVFDWRYAGLYAGLSNAEPTQDCSSTATKKINAVYTEHKPLGRLYKMGDPLFHEFQVIPSANGFQLVCYTATLFTTEAVRERVDPDRRLAHLIRMRVAVVLDFFKWQKHQRAGCLGR
jgi:hypothetical protein